jgi:hypothetical protein
MSETPSDTQQRRRGCVLLLDENINSLTVAETLRKLTGWTIELHSDHFERGADDAAVVAFCGQRGWALVTCDEMRYTPETKAAIEENKTRVLKVIVNKETHGVEIAASLVLARERIIRFLKANRAAVVAHIRRDGTIGAVTRFEAPRLDLTSSQKRTARKFGTGKLF